MIQSELCEAKLFQGADKYYIVARVSGTEVPSLPEGLEYIASSDFRPFTDVETWINEKKTELGGQNVVYLENSDFLRFRLWYILETRGNPNGTNR
ncbi:MAG: hypothetical protein EPN86_01385 [Nanoarchaeota archaeon]|nr:MAG: hypothetical protein EPN86_01385 [Nanoarchaeota archaeon]